MSGEKETEAPATAAVPATPGPTGAPVKPAEEKDPADIEFMGRGGKKKKAAAPGKPKRPPKTQVEEQIDEALAKSSFQGQKKGQRKLQMKIGGVLGVVLLISWTLYSMGQPGKGSMAYGICSVFLESNIRYPHLLRMSTVEEFAASVRIWYTQIDSFGATRMEPIQCYFKQDEKLGTILEKITINRREVNQKRVDDFNRSISTIMSYPPNLDLPWSLPDSLQDLQIETEKFRKPIL